MIATRPRSRRETDARLYLGVSRRDRASPHRDPNVVELVVGITAFLVIASLCLYGIAALGS